MFYPQLTDNLNLAALAVYGEPFTLQTTSGAVELQGIPDYRSQPEGVARVGFSDRMLTMAVTTDVYEANQIAPTAKSGQKIMFRGKEHHILEAQDDLGDMVELTLRRYG